MSANNVTTIGKATIDNIRKGVVVMKKAIKSEQSIVPSIVVFTWGRENELYVGLWQVLKVEKSVNVPESNQVILFTEEGYNVMAKKTENVGDIAKIIQQNAVNKLKKPSYVIPYQEFDDLLLHIANFLEDDNSLNVVYSQGVESFDAYDYIEVEDMVEQVRSKLVGNKQLKGVQIKGIPSVQVYIKVKDYNDTTVSFTYLGRKDNIYKTFAWDGKSDLRAKIKGILSEAKEYDSGLTSSKLNNDSGD